jgi:hypothetical protein
MADYFGNALQGRTAVARSYRYVRLTRRNRQAFLDNLAAAYTNMCRQGEAKGGGLTGAGGGLMLPHDMHEHTTQECLLKKGSC